MEEPKRTRVQLTKAQKRALAEQTTQFAFADTQARKKARDEKTAKLRVLRLALNNTDLEVTKVAVFKLHSI
jgi:hypothetical protein